MLALDLAESGNKQFMNCLLVTEIFDNFTVRDAVISSFARLEISPAAMDAADPEGNVVRTNTVVLWKEVKELVKNYIAGKARPGLIKLVFSISEEALEKHFPASKAVFLNLHFENGKMRLTTGAAQRNFALDKTYEVQWDQYIKDFIARNGWEFTEAV